MSIKHAIASIVLLLSLAAPVTAGPFEDAVAAYNGGDYITSMRLALPLAKGGLAAAQYNVGIMYDNGQGVPQNYVEALTWYRKAAEQGYAPAQNNLAVLYASGEGVPEDDVKALAWYRKAAEQGYAQAQHNLGFMYATGIGVPKDDVLAYKWFNLSAAQGQELSAKMRHFLTLRMTPAQIAEGQKLSRQWKPASQLLSAH